MPVSHPDEAGARRARLAEALVATGARDHAAFARLYDLTGAKLFGICLRICGDRQDAADVLHDVYLAVWRQAGAYEPGRASPITWLATIARNRAIDWARSNPAARRQPLDIVPDLPDDRPSTIDLLVRDERHATLRACLDALDAPQREAIRTAFFDGQTYAEQASRRGVPLGTMKSWVRRGLMRLRECLDGAA